MQVDPTKERTNDLDKTLKIYQNSPWGWKKGKEYRREYRIHK